MGSNRIYFMVLLCLVRLVLASENILWAHGKSKSKPPRQHPQSKTAQGIPQKVLLGGECTDGEGGPQDPHGDYAEVETTSLPPSGYGDGGEKGLGDV